jgi:hypothetical protein
MYEGWCCLDASGQLPFDPLSKVRPKIRHKVVWTQQVKKARKMASFGFNFDDEDIELDQDAEEVTISASRSAEPAIIEPAALPPQKHSLQELVGLQLYQ